MTNGGVGNGNLTKVTQIPGGGAAARVTLNAYDWRNRLVATKTGATGSLSVEDPSVNRPLSFTDYDNLGRVTGRSVFDGDGIWVIDANADRVPDKPAANLLRSSQVSFYDAQDRIYRTQELFVDQATGAVGAPRLTTNMFYDRRGNVAATFAPNAPVTQSSYDGANRLAASYTLGNVPAATWANATSLTASLVLEQAEYGYDAASNVILTTNRQRFHDAAATLLDLPPLNEATSGARILGGRNQGRAGDATGKTGAGRATSPRPSFLTSAENLGVAGRW